MTSVTHRSIAYFQDVTAGTLFWKGWSRAGFKSFAYRLAHLFRIRAAVLVWLSAAFYLV